MMRVVHLGDQVGDGHLQLQGLVAARFAVRHQIQLRTEVMQDVGDLRDHQPARLEEGRRERAGAFLLAFEESLHHRVPLFARDIGVGRAGVFQRQTHELAAPLQAGPVIELVMHGSLRSGKPAP